MGVEFVIKLKEMYRSCFILATQSLNKAGLLNLASEFQNISKACKIMNDILPTIAVMDADVIIIETSYSAMELLDAARSITNHNTLERLRCCDGKIRKALQAVEC